MGPFPFLTQLADKHSLTLVLCTGSVFRIFSDRTTAKSAILSWVVFSRRFCHELLKHNLSQSSDSAKYSRPQLASSQAHSAPLFESSLKVHYHLSSGPRIKKAVPSVTDAFLYSWTREDSNSLPPQCK